MQWQWQQQRQQQQQLQQKQKLQKRQQAQRSWWRFTALALLITIADGIAVIGLERLVATDPAHPLMFGPALLQLGCVAAFWPCCAATMVLLLIAAATAAIRRRRARAAVDAGASHQEHDPDPPATCSSP
ncbi:hypothetical protein D2E26_0231 [Bifidobacterium dolichotidis]|uniref:Uncharacterized protein n=1 Tax=Bifidobacterium dolichotidis TaxID=2306976 RepID=A0A430FS30_9BIFI|nr:hypothetical protein D2E26_0231 [Bifidobacterium dolichotidis]